MCMTDLTPPDALVNSLKSRRGYSLIELMTALILTGIVASSFLGIMTLFSKVNQKSRTILLATAAANNQYERMKSYSFYDLAQLPAHQSILEDSFILQTDMKRYFPETADGAQSNHLDLIIKSSGDNAFLSYLATENLQELASLSGSGSLQVRLEPEDGGIRIQMSDEDGKAAAFHFSTPLHSTIFNVYTQQMNTGQLVNIKFDDSFTGDWEINVFEKPYPCGKVLFHFNDEICQTDQRMRQIDLGGLSIQTIKQQGKANALVYLQVRVYSDSMGSKPVSVCRGIIKVPF
jgi:prepilin-type N-terminal cleavage/methylation domain-containing protein